MFQLIVIIFLFGANGEKIERRYVSKDSFQTLEACKENGAGAIRDFSLIGSDTARGFAYLCVTPGEPV